MAQRPAALGGDQGGRAAFAHEARLRLAPDADERAPGGAITVALCGDWEHDGPCRWPHHTSVDGRTGEDVTVRVIAASPSAEHGQVRRLIDDALAAGELAGPDGLSRWSLLRSGPAALRTDELDLAGGLAAGPPA